jgi:hypothetical protein
VRWPYARRYAWITAADSAALRCLIAALELRAADLLKRA